jgi:hypothetical protein
MAEMGWMAPNAHGSATDVNRQYSDQILSRVAAAIMVADAIEAISVKDEVELM